MIGSNVTSETLHKNIKFIILLLFYIKKRMRQHLSYNSSDQLNLLWCGKQQEVMSVNISLIMKNSRNFCTKFSDTFWSIETVLIQVVARIAANNKIACWSRRKEEKDLKNRSTCKHFNCIPAVHSTRSGSKTKCTLGEKIENLFHVQLSNLYHAVRLYSKRVGRCFPISNR